MLEQRRLAQLEGTQTKIQGNQDSKYQLPEDECGLIHVALIKFKHVPGTEEVERETTVHKFDARRFELMQEMNSFANWDKQVILHDGRVKEAAKAVTPAVPTKPTEPAAPSEPTEPEAPAATAEGEITLEEIQAEYEKVTGNKPGNRKAETLLKEIAEAQSK